jgi:hypothetical protein
MLRSIRLRRLAATPALRRDVHHQRRRHRLDDRRHRAGADDDDPGLALFYSGMVRKKNVLATMAQSLRRSR